MASKTSSESSILKTIERSPGHKVKVAVTDIDGILRGKYLHKDKFLSAAQSGFGFCNVVFGWDINDVCYDNSEYTGWHSGYPDALVKLDLDTYRKVPWDGDIPFFLGEFVQENRKPLEICPRQVLKKMIAKAHEMDFVCMNGMEFEWFNLAETPQSLADKKHFHPQPLTPGMFGYSVLRMAHNKDFFHALMDELNAFGVPLEGLHTETGPGVFEAAILYDEALESADRAVLFKSAAKEIGSRFQIMPSFMAKWNKNLPGCSGHLHQSLWNTSKSKNLFYDPKDPYKMSATFKSYVAGVLKLLPEILPFFAPNINSYKRLVDGYWAPTKPTWGCDNRTVACRIIPGSDKSTRLELRVPGSDVNPYLCIAAALACGLYGIEHGLKLNTPETKGNAYTNQDVERLPRNLQQATQKLSQSTVAHEILGSGFVDHFVRTREWEWRQFQDSVTQWELERYFEIL